MLNEQHLHLGTPLEPCRVVPYMNIPALRGFSVSSGSMVLSNYDRLSSNTPTFSQPGTAFSAINSAFISAAHQVRIGLANHLYSFVKFWSQLHDEYPSQIRMLTRTLDLVLFSLAFCSSHLWCFQTVNGSLDLSLPLRFLPLFDMLLRSPDCELIRLNIFKIICLSVSADTILSWYPHEGVLVCVDKILQTPSVLNSSSKQFCIWLYGFQGL